MTDERVLDIRAYRRRPVARDEFDRLPREGARPRLPRHGITVVGHGGSVHDRDDHVLVRTFPSLPAAAAALGRFSGRDEWFGRLRAGAAGDGR